MILSTNIFIIAENDILAVLSGIKIYSFNILYPGEITKVTVIPWQDRIRFE